jgi:hypothetical protein
MQGRHLNALVNNDPQQIQFVETNQLPCNAIRRSGKTTVRKADGMVKSVFVWATRARRHYEGCLQTGLTPFGDRRFYAAFDVFGFIRYQILVQLPEATADEDAKRVSEIMRQSMMAVTGHGIPAAVEFVIVDCWSKS